MKKCDDFELRLIQASFVISKSRSSFHKVSFTESKSVYWMRSLRKILAWYDWSFFWDIPSAPEFSNSIPSEFSMGLEIPEQSDNDTLLWPWYFVFLSVSGLYCFPSPLYTSHSPFSPKIQPFTLYPCFFCISCTNLLMASVF